MSGFQVYRFSKEEIESLTPKPHIEVFSTSIFVKYKWVCTKFHSLKKTPSGTDTNSLNKRFSPSFFVGDNHEIEIRLELVQKISTNEIGLFVHPSYNPNATSSDTSHDILAIVSQSFIFDSKAEMQPFENFARCMPEFVFHNNQTLILICYILIPIKRSITKSIDKVCFIQEFTTQELYSMESKKSWSNTSAIYNVSFPIIIQFHSNMLINDPFYKKSVEFNINCGEYSKWTFEIAIFYNNVKVTLIEPNDIRVHFWECFMLTNATEVVPFALYSRVRKCHSYWLMPNTWKCYIIQNGFLPIICHVVASKNSNSNNKEIPLIDNRKRKADDCIIEICKYPRLRDNYPSIMDYEILQENKKFSDIELVIEEKHIFAHKVVLSYKSKYFHDILSQEESQSEIKIEGYSFKVIDEIVRYIYTSEIHEASAENYLELLSINKIFQVTDLEKKLESFLFVNIRADNAIKVFLKAHTCELKELKERARKFIVSHTDAIDKNDFNIIVESYPKLLVDIIYPD